MDPNYPSAPPVEASYPPPGPGYQPPQPQPQQYPGGAPGYPTIQPGYAPGPPQAAPTKPGTGYAYNQGHHHHHQGHQHHHHYSNGRAHIGPHHHRHERPGRFGRFGRFGYRFGRRFGGRRERYAPDGTRYASSGSHVSCAGCLFILCVVAAVCLIIPGIVFVSKTGEDERRDRIDSFNDYARNWRAFVKNKKYDDSPPTVVLQAQVICNNNPGGFANYSLPLSEVATDIFTDKEATHDGADPLSPQYKFVQDLTFKNIQPQSCNLKTTIFTNTRLTQTFNHPFANQLTYQCRWKAKSDQDKAYRDCKRKCVNNYGGTFYAETCTYYESLKEICLKTKTEHYLSKPLEGLVPDTSYPVVPDPSTSYGCFYDKAQGDFRMGRYKTGAPQYGDISLRTTVRYSKDAWLGYMRVTEGTGSFGMSVETKMRVGIGLIIPGVICAMIAV